MTGASTVSVAGFQYSPIETPIKVAIDPFSAPSQAIVPNLSAVMRMSGLKNKPTEAAYVSEPIDSVKIAKATRA